MKTWKRCFAIMAALCMLACLTACGNGSTAEVHLIRNADGSYGGSLDEAQYGKGAPKNGKYNVKNSDYYTVNNDYYNMCSTEERILMPHFASYQQTMQDTSGLACLLMILNYAGEDTKSKYTELELLKKYEEVNGTQVYGNGTTEEGLIALVDSLGLGYTADNTCLPITSNNGSTQKIMKNSVNEYIKDGKFLLVRYQAPNDYGWKVVVGYDMMGMVKSTVTEEESDSFKDDVIIFADPYDGGDHFQDGYTTERAVDFMCWWRQMEPNGMVNETYSYLVIDPNIDVTIDYQPVDKTDKQKLYDIHLPLNPDGTYGGTRDADLYGTISSGNGWWNHTHTNYYKINDFYNMSSKGSRVLLPNYTILQQTMASSCGICAVGSILNYYGAEESYYDMELSYLNNYEETTFTMVKGKGSSVTGHHLALTEWGYENEYTQSYKGADPEFPTYESYMTFMRGHLEAGRPIAVSTYLGSGHFITVIGLDDMGTPDHIYDDVIITADPCDYWDGYQDGYVTYSANKFYRQHTNSKQKHLYNTIVVHDKD